MRSGESWYRKYTEHLVQRYGREQVSGWYFEVWNEPDIAYWHGTPEEYYKLYDYAVAGVRAALPNAIVGGPASTGPASEKASTFLDNFLKHCMNDKSAATGQAIPLDFISFHPKGRPTVVDGHVRMGLANELKAASEGFRIVAKYPKYIHLPIILSEADPEGCAACSMKVNPSNAYRNGPLYPTYTAVAIKSLFALQDRYKVNLISMLSWSFEFEDKEYFEGFRTLSTNGVDKPVINVFRMAGLMSGKRVTTSSTGQISLDDVLNAGVRGAPDVDAFATKADHEAAVMLWNYHDDDVPSAGASAQVTIAGIPRGSEKGIVAALSNRRYTQQFVHRMEENGISADSDDRTVCSTEGRGTTGASELSKVVGRERRQGDYCHDTSAAGYIADASEVVMLWRLC